jgi:hypothetical protein
MLSTFISTKPSSIKTVSPGFKSLTIPLWETVAWLISPVTSVVVKVNFCPSCNITGSANLPNLISGPFVSKMQGILSPNSFSIFLKRSILSLCSGWVP